MKTNINIGDLMQDLAEYLGVQRYTLEQALREIVRKQHHGEL